MASNRTIIARSPKHKWRYILTDFRKLLVESLDRCETKWDEKFEVLVAW